MKEGEEEEIETGEAEDTRVEELSEGVELGVVASRKYSR